MNDRYRRDESRRDRTWDQGWQSGSRQQEQFSDYSGQQGGGYDEDQRTRWRDSGQSFREDEDESYRAQSDNPYGQSGSATYGTASRGEYGRSGRQGLDNGRSWNAPRDFYGSGSAGYGDRERSDFGGRSYSGPAYTTGGYGRIDYGRGEARYGGTRYGASEYDRGERSYQSRDDRSFLERAGDEVRSWFGDDDAMRRREQDHRGRGPSDYKRSDERIREDANDRLTDDWKVDARNVTVQVKDGEVTLNGTVDSREAKRRAEDCVDAVSGVKHVQNNLRVSENQAFGYSATGYGASTAGSQATGTPATGLTDTTGAGTATGTTTGKTTV